MGTHKDEIPGHADHEKISEALEGIVHEVAWRSLIHNKEEGLCFFPVNCKEGQADLS